MQQSDNLSVEEALTEGGHADDVQAEVGTGELDLTVTELHLNRALQSWAHHEDSFGAGDPDLKGGCPCCSEVILGDFGGQLFTDVSDSVCEVEAIPLDIRQVHLDVFRAQGGNELGSGEALTFASKSFQDILLVIK